MSNRRKTLSHAEIDDFLCDISISSDKYKDSDTSYASSTVSNISSSSSSSSRKCYDENSKPNIAQGNIECNKTLMKPLHQQKQKQQCQITVDITSKISNAISTISPDESIREFCRISFKDKHTVDDYIRICELGKNVVESTNYRLLPSRTVYPELYPHPPSSIEGKRAFLLQLSPMLGEGEVQRVKDVKACEDSTECRVEKSKKSNSSYQYVDITTNRAISHEAYERRYMSFIHHEKNKLKMADFNDTDSGTGNAIEASCDLTAISPVDDAAVYVIESIEEVPILVEVQSSLSLSPPPPPLPTSKSRSRRVTLSPASARSMMLRAIDVDTDSSNDTNFANSNDATAETVLAQNDTQSKIITEDDAMLANLANELDAILANADNFDTMCSSSSDSDSNAVEATESINQIASVDCAASDVHSLESVHDNVDIEDSCSTEDSIEITEIVHVDSGVDTDVFQLTTDTDDIGLVVEGTEAAVAISSELERSSIEASMTEDSVAVEMDAMEVSEAAPIAEELKQVPIDPVISDLMLQVDAIDINVNADVYVDAVDTIEVEAVEVIDGLVEANAIVLDQVTVDTDPIDDTVVDECVVEVDPYELMEQNAFIRLDVRLEQARWKYQWEIVSFHAIKKANRRICNNYSSNSCCGDSSINV